MGERLGTLPIESQTMNVEQGSRSLPIEVQIIEVGEGLESFPIESQTMNVEEGSRSLPIEISVKEVKEGLGLGARTGMDELINSAQSIKNGISH